jgi:NAD(P)-dependent dehydrogenase (short-subunit alcohol dehydrogenase family)
LAGKVCMVTGCNSGIGKVTARELARMGATVVMVCRNSDSGRAALKEIEQATGSKDMDLFVADLSSQQAIRQLVEDFRKQYANLHVLVNNAGILCRKRTLTVDGIETQFAVNLMAPFFLIKSLHDVLEASAPARVISVTSKMHRYAKIDFGNLQGEKKYTVWNAYNQAKLGLIIVTYEWARKFEGKMVTANCLHPGVVGTGIAREFPAVVRLFWERFLPSPEKGAETPIYLASSPELEGVNGRYFEEKKEMKSSKRSYDRLTTERLWAACEELLLDSSL